MQSGPGRAATGPHKLDFIGDHLAIDFINTLRAVEPYEVFQTDEDVRKWLLRAGVSASPQTVNWPQGALVRKAHELREIALKAVQAKKAGKRPSLEGLNAFLEHAASHPRAMVRRGSIEIGKVYSDRTVEGFLAPVAEAVADLLANGDFELVRHCEGHDCVLWFYDRTKAHRRRWCSAAACGNRAKVAAFRERSQKQ